MKSCIHDDRFVYPVLKQIHSSSPIVTLVEGLLLNEEADYLIQRAGGMHRSEIERSDAESRVDKIRTSSTASLPDDDTVSEIQGSYAKKNIHGNW